MTTVTGQSDKRTKPSDIAASGRSRLNPPAPLRANIAAEWALDPRIAFMNHGSFGARPKIVLDAQLKRRNEFEASPIEFLHRARNGMIDVAKGALSPLLG